jgi:hypothetical protein
MLRSLFRPRPTTYRRPQSRTAASRACSGGPDPPAGLLRLGAEPGWQADGVALGGAPTATDRTGAGSRAATSCWTTRRSCGRALDFPRADPLALLAELVRVHGPDAGVHALGMYGAAVWDSVSGSYG